MPGANITWPEFSIWPPLQKIQTVLPVPPFLDPALFPLSDAASPGGCWESGLVMAHPHCAGWSSGDWHRPIINLPFYWCPHGFFLLPFFVFFYCFFLFFIFYFFISYSSVLLIFKLFIYLFSSSFFLSFSYKFSFLFFSFIPTFFFFLFPFFNLCLFNSLSSAYARFCNVYR